MEANCLCYPHLATKGYSLENVLEHLFKAVNKEVNPRTRVLGSSPTTRARWRKCSDLAIPVVELLDKKSSLLTPENGTLPNVNHRLRPNVSFLGQPRSQPAREDYNFQAVSRVVA